MSKLKVVITDTIANFTATAIDLGYEPTIKSNLYDKVLGNTVVEIANPETYDVFLTNYIQHLLVTNLNLAANVKAEKAAQKAAQAVIDANKLATDALIVVNYA